MTIIVVLGTRAQLIKMAPVLREMEKRGMRIRLILTGQHKTTIDKLIDEFRIKTRPIVLYDGREITGVARMAFWFVRIVVSMYKRRKELFFSDPDIRYLVVHGDTVSTLAGAVIGRLTGKKVVHVESGLRSFQMFHPFPEEITRILVLRFTDIAFCPGEWASKNMHRYQIRAVDTQANTLLDAVRYAIDTEGGSGIDVKLPYGVVSVHRFENIFFTSRFKRIVRALERMAQQFHLVFVLHPATEKRLKKCGLYERLEQHPTITMMPRMTYVPFIKLLKGARFVVTDGGSNQEELFYLGIPTLLMRKATERTEGIGKTAVVCNYDNHRIERFLANLDTYASTGALVNNADLKPSEVIVDALVSSQPAD